MQGTKLLSNRFGFLQPLMVSKDKSKFNEEHARKLGLYIKNGAGGAFNDIKKDILIQTYLEENVFTKIVVTEEELDQYYVDNLDQFQSPETVEAAHILLCFDESCVLSIKSLCVVVTEDFTGFRCSFRKLF